MAPGIVNNNMEEEQKPGAAKGTATQPPPPGVPDMTGPLTNDRGYQQYEGSEAPPSTRDEVETYEAFKPTEEQPNYSAPVRKPGMPADIAGVEVSKVGAGSIGAGTKGKWANARTGYVTEDMTVESRLNNLLSKENDYIKRARMRGMAQGASRGLVNSSMSAGAAHGAAIQAALPIAQQDSQSFVEQGLKAQQGDIDLSKIGMQGDVDMSKMGQQFKYDSALTNAKETAANNRMMYGEKAATSRSIYETDSKAYQADLERESTERVAKWDRISREMLQGAEIDESARQSDNAIVAENEKKYGTIVESLSKEYLASKRSILENPDIKADDKPKLIADLENTYQDQVEMQADIFGFAVEWDGQVDPGSNQQDDEGEDGGGGGGDGAEGSENNVGDRTTHPMIGGWGYDDGTNNV